ncbi:hypothetical protein [Insolitispirillum peregrinum]|uniref:Uncharacterized protein n=1 Tax=Insolitispirillum peregrinum TaxID=80876 RepID=A0A1N7JUM8_9PROT|nr:hypothetical protein [Insolitispirillum peregrinum]SIS53037.1 hypothetical protein SAMN05421779_102475 [Insolitispirillum peregrinum]
MLGLIVLFIAAGVLTCAWLGGALLYVSNSVGWDNLLLMMPNDLALFAFGVFGPVALLWLVLGLIQTTLSNHRQESVLRQMVVQERRASDQIEAQVRTLIQMQGESRRRSVIDGMDLVLKDLNGQAAVLAERLGMISQDEADTLWGRTVAGDVWAFSYAFLTRAEAYEDFPDLLAERLAHDEISSSALQLFLRRYDLLLESFRETDADKLARAVLEDGPLARLHSLFATVNLRALRLRQGYEEIPRDSYADSHAPAVGTVAGYVDEDFQLDPDPEIRPRFGVEDFPDDFGVPHDEVQERETLEQQARQRSGFHALPDDYASEPLAQEGLSGSHDFSINHDENRPVGYGTYRPLIATPEDSSPLSASASTVGGYGRPIPGGRSTWSGQSASGQSGFGQSGAGRYGARKNDAGQRGDSDDALIVGAERTAYAPKSFTAPQFVRSHEPPLVTVGQNEDFASAADTIPEQPVVIHDVAPSPPALAPLVDSGYTDPLYADSPLGSHDAPLDDDEDEEAFVLTAYGDDVAHGFELEEQVAALVDDATPVAEAEAEEEYFIADDFDLQTLSAGLSPDQTLPLAETPEDAAAVQDIEDAEEMLAMDSHADAVTTETVAPDLPAPGLSEPNLPYAALAADTETMEESMARLHDVLRRMNSDDDTPAPGNATPEHTASEDVPHGDRPLLPS